MEAKHTRHRKNLLQYTFLVLGLFVLGVLVFYRLFWKTRRRASISPRPNLNSSQSALIDDVVRSPGRRTDRARRRRSSVSRGLNLDDLQLQRIQRPPPTHSWQGRSRQPSEDDLPRYEANGGPPKYQESGTVETSTSDPPQPQPPEMSRSGGAQPEDRFHIR
ncbi:hypothetical protein BKA70DRAFT_1441581 [Coprinopsis sp. MPI-PUGE-AT-0042]|nr:hypothetical protein BKA70DRAFT_1441581 [Coprinopsis sp. MPI-PUGE-AT-0042]